MVTIKNYHVRQKADGTESFISLEIIGDIELVQSTNTGRFYATLRKCFISSTFDEPTAKMMLGKSLPGSIQRTQCEPYEFTIPETGEIITISYRWEYSPEEILVSEKVGVAA